MRTNQSVRWRVGGQENCGRRGDRRYSDLQIGGKQIGLKTTMKKLILLLLVAASVVGYTGELRGEAIPVGWEQLHWGAKGADIIKAYPAAKPMAKPESRGPFGARMYAAKFSMPGVTIAGIEFTAYFLMDDTDSLAAVQFWKDVATDKEGKQAYDAVKEYLNKKYFRQTKEENLATPDNGVSPGSVRADWNSANANVNLIFLSIKDIVRKTSLSYEKP